MAIITKAQYLHGMQQRRADRHKQEGRANYPGRSDVLPLILFFFFSVLLTSRDVGMGYQKSAEAVVVLLNR